MAKEAENYYRAMAGMPCRLPRTWRIPITWSDARPGADLRTAAIRRRMDELRRAGR